MNHTDKGGGRWSFFNSCNWNLGSRDSVIFFTEEAFGYSLLKKGTNFDYLSEIYKIIL